MTTDPYPTEGAYTASANSPIILKRKGLHYRHFQPQDSMYLRPCLTVGHMLQREY